MKAISSAYSISKSKMQGNFEPGFDSHRIKFQNKTQDHLNNLSTNKTGGEEEEGGGGVNIMHTYVGRTCRIGTITKHQYKL